MASKKRSAKSAVSPQSPLAAKIIQKWGRAGETVTIERITSELEEVSRYDIVAALKELHKAELGELTVGHAGQRSRFVWGGRVAAARSDARGNKAKSVDLPVAARAVVPPAPLRAGAAAARHTSTDDDALDHVFHLRPGFLASLRLPADVTELEMQRFCQFLQAIPFADSGSGK